MCVHSLPGGGGGAQAGGGLGVKFKYSVLPPRLHCTQAMERISLGASGDVNSPSLRNLKVSSCPFPDHHKPQSSTLQPTRRPLTPVWSDGAGSLRQVARGRERTDDLGRQWEDPVDNVRQLSLRPPHTPWALIPESPLAEAVQVGRRSSISPCPPTPASPVGDRVLWKGQDWAPGQLSSPDLPEPLNWDIGEAC